VKSEAEAQSPLVGFNRLPKIALVPPAVSLQLLPMAAKAIQ
jgi:hypothetical protein